MRLIETSITNFRGIGDTIHLNFNQFNVFVGQNDAGKSTILKALDIFINGKSINLQDKNVNATNNDIIIELTFDSNNRLISIDSDLETTFENEDLTNENGFLQIKKVWDMTNSTAKPITYIKRKIYIDNDLLLLTDSGLFGKCQELGVMAQNGDGIELDSNSLRRAIRQKLIENQVPHSYVEEKLSGSKNPRTKSVLESIRLAMPRFELFRADTSLSETDTAIQNYFRVLASRSLQEFGIGEIENSVKEDLDIVLSAITEKINKLVSAEEEVTINTEFDWTKLIKISFKTRNQEFSIPLSHRGDGFRRITMMAYFEHLASADTASLQDVIFGFEEPETFLHPSAQERLLEQLVDMSENNYQILISTHSPIIVAKSNKGDLIHVEKEGTNIKIGQNIEDISSIVRDLGISLNNQFISLFDRAKVLLLVEGRDDAEALNYVSSLYKENSLIPKSFDELGTAIIPIGGKDSIEHWVALDLLNRLSKPFFIYLDSDKDSSSVSSTI